MLFNSYEFLFAFLPLTLLGYYALWLRSNHDAAKLFLVLASLFFYAWWDVRNLWILGVSVVGNYLLAQLLWRQSDASDVLRRWVVVIGSVG